MLVFWSKQPVWAETVLKNGLGRSAILFTFTERYCVQDKKIGLTDSYVSFVNIWDLKDSKLLFFTISPFEQTQFVEAGMVSLKFYFLYQGYTWGVRVLKMLAF